MNVTIRDDFKEIIKEIQEHGKEFKLSVKDFLGFFHYEKRTKGNRTRIDHFLEKYNLETFPNYVNVWVYGDLILRHKPKATSKSKSDPIQRISILPSANKPPLTIARDAKISEAITVMLMNDYSQIPVMSNPKSVAGYVTWESIGSATFNGYKSEDVKDFMASKNPILLDYETPLLDAIKTVIDHNFALVQKKDKSLSGIVTITDISTEFLSLTEPFLLLEQIENSIRLLLNEKFLIEDLKAFCSETVSEKGFETVDELSFGQYVMLIEKESNWRKLGLKIERVPFIKQLCLIRDIRNDIMHFDPEGISLEQKTALHNMANFLTEVLKHQ